MFFDMLFQFLIYHVDEHLATKLGCCLVDLYFSVDRWEDSEIIIGFTPQITTACIERFCLQFIHYCFDEIYCISNAEGFPAVRELAVWIGING
jgi:hypothetical protein